MKTTKRRYLEISLLMQCSFGLFGCQFTNSENPNIVLLAVDQLPLDAINCAKFEDSVEVFSGFRDLCREGVRFTHAYTTSTLAKPAFASLLTAQYPSRNQIWSNGPQVLPADVQTVAELAYEKGYRTAFFSSGPPVFRISNLQQGFEFVQDSYWLTPNRLNMRFAELRNLMESWIAKEAEPFFVAAYLNDLLFLSSELRDHAGVLRPMSEQGVLDELDEKLGMFISMLKKGQRWDNTYFFLVGLNGKSYPFRTVINKPLNLHFENTAVSLFIKPKTKQRDLGLHWKVDRNISIVDVGATIFEILGEKRLRKGLFSVESLLSEIHAKDYQGQLDRFIVTESAWASWLGLGVSRFGVRFLNHFYLHDVKNDKVYNTLIDRFEVSAAVPQEERVISHLKQIRSHFEEEGSDRFQALDEKIFNRLDFLKDLASSKRLTPELFHWLRVNLKLKPEDDLAVYLYATTAIRAGDWQQLLNVGTLSKSSDLILIAQNQLDLKERDRNADPCLFEMAKKNSRRAQKICKDPEVRLFNRYLAAEDKGSKEYFALQLSRVLFYKRARLEVVKKNLLLDLAWFPDQVEDYRVSPLNMVLSLPQYSTHAKRLQRSSRQLHFMN